MYCLSILFFEINLIQFKTVPYIRFDCSVYFLSIFSFECTTIAITYEDGKDEKHMDTCMVDICYDADSGKRK